jgi:hypothetical protein
MNNSDLLDMDTRARLMQASPKVTAIPFDAAQAGVKALRQYMQTGESHTDLDGKKYWEALLKDILDESSLITEPKMLGQIMRTLGLILWREMDGTHVAWSEEQYKILRKYFKA